MKALKITLVCLALILVAFICIGVAVPSYNYQFSTRVKASPEKCWRTFHNTRLMNQWISGLESFVLKSGDSLALGSIYEIVVNDDGHRMAMSEKIIEVAAPARVSYELNNDVLKSEFTFSFEGDSSTTMINSHYKITGNNIAWKSILFLSKSYMSSSANDQLISLKKVIEEQP